MKTLTVNAAKLIIAKRYSFMQLLEEWDNAGLEATSGADQYETFESDEEKDEWFHEEMSDPFYDTNGIFADQIEPRACVEMSIDERIELKQWIIETIKQHSDIEYNELRKQAYKRTWWQLIWFRGAKYED